MPGDHDMANPAQHLEQFVQGRGAPALERNINATNALVQLMRKSSFEIQRKIPNHHFQRG